MRIEVGRRGREGRREEIKAVWVGEELRRDNGAGGIIRVNGNIIIGERRESDVDKGWTDINCSAAVDDANAWKRQNSSYIIIINKD